MKLLRDENYIIEDYRVNDLLEFTAQRDHVLQFIDHATDRSLIGLLGDYGTGKSTVLHQIAELRHETEHWIRFDAWKYPDRNELWEGFVLDVANQVGKRPETARTIDGRLSKKETVLKGVVGTMMSAGR